MFSFSKINFGGLLKKLAFSNRAWEERERRGNWEVNVIRLRNDYHAARMMWKQIKAEPQGKVLIRPALPFLLLKCRLSEQQWRGTPKAVKWRLWRDHLRRTGKQLKCQLERSFFVVVVFVARLVSSAKSQRITRFSLSPWAALLELP